MRICLQGGKAGKGRAGEEEQWTGGKGGWRHGTWRAHTHTHTCTHTRTHTDTHTHARTCTDTHTHTDLFSSRQQYTARCTPPFSHTAGALLSNASLCSSVHCHASLSPSAAPTHSNSSSHAHCARLKLRCLQEKAGRPWQHIGTHSQALDCYSTKAKR